MMKKYFVYVCFTVLLVISGLFLFDCKAQTLSFGIIADIQYSDKDTRGRRHYRESLLKLDEAIIELNKVRPAFTIQLGDIIDGHSNDRDGSVKDLMLILSSIEKLTMPFYHVVGNHCLSTGEENLRKLLGLDSFYYEFTITGIPGWRFVVLDGNDAGYGIISDKQMQWFGSVLQKASLGNEKVVVFCHYALIREAAMHHRMAEPEEILGLLRDHECVVAWLAGHDHAGGYAYQDGIHHITMKGMVESPDNNAFAIIELYDHKIRIIGYGDEPNRELLIDH